MDDLIKIVNSLYDTVLHNGSWSDVLNASAEYCDSPSFQLVISDQATEFNALEAPRVDPDFITGYNELWWRHDPVRPLMLSSPVGKIVSQRDLTDVDSKGIPFFNDFWMKTEFGIEFLASNLMLSNGVYAAASMQVPARQDVLEDNQYHRFASLLPHLERAVALQNKFLRLRLENELMSASDAGETRTANLLVDLKCRPVSSDARGDRLLSSERLPVRDGRIRLKDTTTQARLERAIAIAGGRFLDLPSIAPILCRATDNGPDLEIEALPSKRDLPGGGPLLYRPTVLLRIREVVAHPIEKEDPPTRNTQVSARTATTRFDAISQDIRDNFADPELTLDRLSKKHRLSPRAIRNLFYAKGTNFTDFLMSLRLDHAREMLTDPKHDGENISEIALAAGFGDISWFHQVFRRRFGMTPSEMRKRAGDDQRIDAAPTP
jgi:AraC-like DNA-binding protein